MKREKKESLKGWKTGKAVVSDQWLIQLGVNAVRVKGAVAVGAISCKRLPSN